MASHEFFKQAHDLTFTGSTINSVGGDQHNVTNNDDRRITGSYNTYNSNNTNSNNHNSNVGNTNSNNTYNGWDQRQPHVPYHDPGYARRNAYAPGSHNPNPGRYWEEEPYDEDEEVESWEHGSSGHGRGQNRGMPRMGYHQHTDPRNGMRQGLSAHPPPAPPSNRSSHSRNQQGWDQAPAPAPFSSGGRSGPEYVDQWGDPIYRGPGQGQRRPNPSQYPSEPAFNYQGQPPPTPPSSAPPSYYGQNQHIPPQPPYYQQDVSFSQAYPEAAANDYRPQPENFSSSTSTNRHRASEAAGPNYYRAQPENSSSSTSMNRHRAPEAAGLNDYRPQPENFSSSTSTNRHRDSKNPFYYHGSSSQRSDEQGRRRYDG
ncbi:hypothetical protein VKT23_011733 [Stygiomarasmius scandens]|uniref:Enamelin n=1 Tax=Marasmiellus scandens TaxID=2682957 RepID=A0ABR1J7V7_9AGAR